MIRRGGGAVALLLWLVSLALAIAAGMISSASGYVVVVLILNTIGAVLAWRRPANLVGWLIEFLGFLVALVVFTFAYAVRGLVDAPGSLPAATTVAWLYSWAFPPLFGVVGSIFLLFPNGRLLSPRWRVVLWAQWVTVAVFAGGVAFFTETAAAVPGYRNPYLIVSFPELLQLSPVLLLPSVAAALSLILRSRRARGAERQQLKWVGYAVALFTLTFVGGAALNGLVQLGLPKPDGFAAAAGDVISFGSFLAVPLAIAVAVMRYRLYDIDLLINRTLVYGSLTAVLVLAYVAGVAAFQFLLSPFTSGSPIAVAVSTLAVVALFQPLRRGIQSAVDRRFYRRRYDAERTLDAFAARLREQIDLGALEGELLDAVRETVQPAHAGVWLRERAR